MEEEASFSLFGLVVRDSDGLTGPSSLICKTNLPFLVQCPARKPRMKQTDQHSEFGVSWCFDLTVEMKVQM